MLRKRNAEGKWHERLRWVGGTEDITELFDEEREETGQSEVDDPQRTLEKRDYGMRKDDESEETE